MNNNIFYFRNGSLILNNFSGGVLIGVGLSGLGFFNIGSVGSNVVINNILAYVVLFSGGGMGVNNFFFNAVVGNLGFLGLLLLSL